MCSIYEGMFSIYESMCSIYESMCSIYESMFSIYKSMFSIYGSMFCIYRWGKTCFYLILIKISDEKTIDILRSHINLLQDIAF